MTYDDLITRKASRLRGHQVGITVTENDIHPALFPFQRKIVRRSLAMGTAALFEDCGLGKTIQEIEWARHVISETGKPVLIVAPLAVGRQMVIEGERIDVPVTLVRRQTDCHPAVNVTNYEMLQHFNPAAFGGLVLDESSILKNQLGAMRTAIVTFASHIPYKLAATATPAPNDLLELLNHAAYLGRMSVKEAQAMWFTQDGNSTHDWRLKGHAAHSFWDWCGTWAIAVRKPDDIGCPMPGYDLPDLDIIDHAVLVDIPPNIQMGLMPVAQGIQGVRSMRRRTLVDRVQACAELVNSNAEPWVVWCELNDESSALAKAIPDAVEVRGSDSIERKTQALTDFSEGRARVVVTKPSIAGHGLNWQHCARMAFIGVGYSYEMQYQAIRRCWRYGQTRPVQVYRFCSDVDQHIIDTIEEKGQDAMSLYDMIPWQVDGDFARHAHFAGGADVACGANWTLHMGDSVETIASVADNSVGLSVFSPPFPGMYVYTDSPHDMGNVQTIGEMIDQFAYLMDSGHLLRAMMPGRSAFIHITQGVAQLGRDGYIGLRDFRGKIIDMMQSNGWIYYGEVTIDKNPQVKAIRTKDSGLTFKSLATDSARLHPALSDMLLQFRKPGANAEPIRAGRSERYGNMTGWVSADDWILWARPVWYAADYQPAGSEGIQGIRETDVLNVSASRSDRDERHLCPLQIGVIERCVKVWSNPGDTVYSPFAGVGSEGVVALREGRKFVGGELKREYWETACRNMETADAQMSFFDLLTPVAAD